MRITDDDRAAWQEATDPHRVRAACRAWDAARRRAERAATEARARTQPKTAEPEPDDEPDETGVRRLAVAVIGRALRDAASPAISAALRVQARAWLAHRSHGRDLWCELAGVSGDRLAASIPRVRRMLGDEDL